MEIRPTMTLNELTCDLRKCGVKTSPTKVKAMIQQGKIPNLQILAKWLTQNLRFTVSRLKNGKNEWD